MSAIPYRMRNHISAREVHRRHRERHPDQPDQLPGHQLERRHGSEQHLGDPLPLLLDDPLHRRRRPDHDDHEHQANEYGREEEVCELCSFLRIFVLPRGRQLRECMILEGDALLHRCYRRRVDAPIPESPGTDLGVQRLLGPGRELMLIWLLRLEPDRRCVVHLVRWLKRVAPDREDLRADFEDPFELVPGDSLREFVPLGRDRIWRRVGCRYDFDGNSGRNLSVRLRVDCQMLVVLLGGCGQGGASSPPLRSTTANLLSFVSSSFLKSTWMPMLPNISAGISTMETTNALVRTAARYSRRAMTQTLRMGLSHSAFGAG